MCVFDQAFYAKAAEIFWRHRDMFEKLVIMLGGFPFTNDVTWSDGYMIWRCRSQRDRNSE